MRRGWRWLWISNRTVADKVYGTRVFTIKDCTIDLDKGGETYDFCALMLKEYGLDPRDEKVDWSAVLERNIPFEKECRR